MIYKIKFHPLAEKELKDLDGRVKILVIKQIQKIRGNPNYGEDLGNKHGYDLTGYKKIYVDNKKIRIIYKVEKELVLIKIIAIGKREDLEVYKDSNKRKFY
jgi:mRNA interferase RelE/StbE